MIVFNESGKTGIEEVKAQVIVLGGVMVIVLAILPNVRRFKPGRVR
jgi:hypothetical protein